MGLGHIDLSSVGTQRFLTQAIHSQYSIKLARTSIFWKIFDFDGSLHGEMGSLYHVIKKT